MGSTDRGPPRRRCCSYPACSGCQCCSGMPPPTHRHSPHSHNPHAHNPHIHTPAPTFPPCSTLNGCAAYCEHQSATSCASSNYAAITSSSVCDAAAACMGYADTASQDSGASSATAPDGCYYNYNKGKLYFNSGTSGQTFHDSARLQKRNYMSAYLFRRGRCGFRQRQENNMHDADPITHALAYGAQFCTSG